MSAPTAPDIPDGDSGDPQLPPPPAANCPACGAPLLPPIAGRCPGCAIDVSDPSFEHILDLDRRWVALAAEREAHLARLIATRPPAPPPPVAPPVAPPPGAPPPATRRLSVPAVLALGGVGMLVAAAVVFTAVTWSTLPALVQATILVAATVVAGSTALTLDRRALRTAAGALGVLTMALAAVDVLGLDRSGLLALRDFVAPIGSVVAAAVGWGLARAGLRWVATAGAAALVLAAVTTTAAVAEAADPAPGVLSLLGSATALAVVASALTWSSVPAKRTAAIGGTAWLTLAGIIGVVAVGNGDLGVAAGLGVIALPIAALLVGLRWSDVVLGPAVLLTTLTVVAVAANLEWAGLPVPVAASAGVAAVAWGATRLAATRRVAALVGAIPVAAIAVAATLAAVATTVERLVATLSGEPAPDLMGPSRAAVVVLVGIALLTVPRVRRSVGWVALPAVAVLSGAVLSSVAWPVLLAIALGVGAAPARLRSDPLAVLGVALVAVGWAGGASWTTAVAAAAAAALGWWLSSRTDPIRGATSTGLALVMSGLGAGAATRAVGAPLDVALGVGLAAVFLGAVVGPLVGRWRRAPAGIVPAGLVVAGLATVQVPSLAASLRAAGVLLLVAATGWLALAASGLPPVRWVAAAVASVGTGLILADAGVEVVEAYTAVPTVALAGAGLWWLAEDRSIRTAAALSPALAVGLVPSLMVLTSDPRALGRALGVALAVAALAAVGLQVRWLAPVVAGSVGALWLAATQLAIAAAAAPRWVTFAVVGVLLVWLAATYERQQARARRLRSHLADLR